MSIDYLLIWVFSWSPYYFQLNVFRCAQESELFDNGESGCISFHAHDTIETCHAICLIYQPLVPDLLWIVF